MNAEKLNQLWQRFVYAIGRLSILGRPFLHVVEKWDSLWYLRGLPQTMQAHRLGVDEANDPKDAEIRRLKALINRDKTGLAKGLNAVRQVFHGYAWIPAGEWGSYEWDERTEKAFRAEIGRCFDEAEKIAVDALRASGSLANEAFHGPKTPTDAELFAKIERGKTAAETLGVPFLEGRRCPKCQGLMIHTRLGGYRCNRGCQ